MTPPDAPRRLGRGLDALLAGRSAAKPAPEPTRDDAPRTDRDRSSPRTTDDAPPTASAAANAAANAAEAPAAADGRLARLPIASIAPNPYQPRREFLPADLAELQASLAASGLLQPITVRAVGGERYELIAGERRLRAATALGWTDIPAVVREIDDEDALTLALIENLQRSDLDALEEAEGYQRLIEEFGATQSQVADAVGKNRSTVANALRLLALPASVRRMVHERTLSAGHARALLAISDEHALVDMARTAVSEGWSVREIERRIQSLRPARPNKPKTPSATTASTAPSATRQIDDLLRRRFQTSARVALSGREQGEVRIAFTSNDDLERILALMGITVD